MPLTTNFRTFNLFTFLILFTLSLQAQTGTVIQQNQALNGINSMLDPNGDGYITKTNAPFSGNGVSEISEFENLASGSSLIVPWTGINALEAEPGGDPGLGNSCDQTDIVSDGINPHTFAYFTVFRHAGTDYVAFRVRVADYNVGTRGFSVLVTNDGLLGAFGAIADPKYLCGNAGFEREILLNTGTGMVGVYEVTNVVNQSPSAQPMAGMNFPMNWQVASAEYSNAGCNNGQTPVFYTVYVPIHTLGISVAINPAQVGVVVCSTTDGNSALGGAMADVGGLDGNGLNDPCGCLNLPIDPNCPDAMMDCKLSCLACGITTFPVEWQSVNAQVQTTGIELEWTVAQEINNNFFSIERQTGSGEFEEIAKVPGRGTASSAYTYHFHDPFLVLEDVYYRVKQTDLDGSASYSPIVLVQSEGSKIEGRLSANGMDPSITLHWFTPQHMPAYFSIMNLDGREVRRDYVQLSTGNSSHEISIDQLPTGVYLFQVLEESGYPLYVQKFIKR